MSDETTRQDTTSPPLAAPIQSPISHWAIVPGTPEPVEVYELNLGLLSLEQRERLIRHLARRYRMAPVAVRDLLGSEGLPVLAGGVTVTFDARLLA